MDPVLAILNNVIKDNLGAINSKIVSGIRSKHLDPMAHVASGSQSLGQINLGIGHAGATAHYEIGNLRGLSSLKLDRLEITSGGADPNDPSTINGAIAMHAALSSKISAHAGGGIDAHLGFIHKDVGISGTVTVHSVVAASTGSFSASLKGGQICLVKARLSQLGINYSSADVNISGLGFFNELLKPLESVILDATKNAIRGAVAQALTPVLNSEIATVLPICGKVG